MLDTTYSYRTLTDEITIRGFIASLLLQGDAWDIRCLKVDMYDYHQQQYTRMDPTIALRQELQWWIDFMDAEALKQIPNRELLSEAGITYLSWRVHEQLMPLNDSDKLTCRMAIFLDQNHYFYKQEESLTLFSLEHEPTFDLLMHGFPAQLLTYAACTTVDSFLREPSISNPYLWVEIILGWLQPTPSIFLHNINFAIPDVYALYQAYLADAHQQWLADNRRRLQAGEPQTRYFMTRLLQQTKLESDEAILFASNYFNSQQQTAFAHYLSECQQYIIQNTTSKRQVRSEQLNQFYEPEALRYPRHMATRRLHEAANDPINPAAALAKMVKHLQNKKILKLDIRPHTHFIAVINKTFGTSIKHDSFSKHFRP